MSRQTSIIPFFILAVFAAGCQPEVEPAAPAAGRPTATVSAGGPPASTPGAACMAAFARRDRARVTAVTDGDSIEVTLNGVPFRVRYIGIDAPEMGLEPFAEEAREANLELVDGKEIWLIRDVSEADRYGRLLRFVMAGDTFVNQELVQRGLARAGDYPPDTACSGWLMDAEAKAQAAGAGLWGGSVAPSMDVTVPAGAGCPQGCVTPPPGCRIKGNLNADGNRIFHVPGGMSYENTVIEPEKGERWFCTEAEAEAAGWRRAKS